MADEEQLEILKSGVDEWNAWRKENADARIDLFRADLRGADLRWGDLTAADLIRGDLVGADLTGADLRSGKLVNADLSEADLDRANFLGANLSGASLIGTNLRGTSILSADLRRTDFADSTWNSTHLNETIFGDTNLKGLEAELVKARFHGPCTIDSRTIQKSWPLPESFLKGCGLSDRDIEYAKLFDQSLTSHECAEIVHRIGLLVAEENPIQFHHCFISYTGRDDGVARRIDASLKAKGVRTWFAPKNLKTGDRFRDVIANEIRVTEKLLVILSKNSIGSRWVRREVEQTLRREDKTGETILFPIRLDGAVFECEEAWADEIQGERQILDFTQWKDDKGFEAAVQRLLRDLEKAAAK